MVSTADTGQMPQKANNTAWMIYWVIASGVAVRAVAAIYTCVMNPDGMVYIQQAKAIHQGDWMQLRSCVPFVSSYPFFIAAAHWAFPSWIASARIVSVFFGSLTLVPLYFLLRRFADQRTACVSVLLYAFMPVLVGGSADLIRDPICWFFLVSGLYFFVKHLERTETYRRRLCYLTSSYFLFLMSGWARPETFMVLIFSCCFTFVYALLSKQKVYLLVSISSLLLFGIFVASAAMFFDPSFGTYSTTASSKFSASLETYRNLRQQLGAVAEGLDQGALRSFLFKTSKFIWLVDLGVLVGSSVAAIFYPFIPFLVLGFFGLTARLRNDPRVVYLFILVTLGYVLLFVHVLQFWYVEHRFLHIVIFSGSILAAFGIEHAGRFLQNRLHWQSAVAVILICVYILAFGLGKNIRKREEDKVVFRQIAEYISNIEKPVNVFIPVLTSNKPSLKLVPMYLNLDLPSGFCPLQTAPDIRDNDSLLQYVKVNQVRYFLWDEKNWRKTQVNIDAEDFRQNFDYLDRWHHPEYGELMLFCRR